MNMGQTAFGQQDFGCAMETAFSALAEQMSTYADEWFCQPIRSLLEDLCQEQQQNKMGPIFCVSVSMLRSALLCGQPGYRIDVYGQDWFLYEHPLVSSFVPCPWLLPLWAKLVSHFQKILDQQEVQKYCSPLQAEQAAWQCTGPLFSIMGSLLKYLVRHVEKSECFHRLVKGNEFKIEFGEFLDWKLTLAAEYPEIDLFNSRGRRFPHRRFVNKVFDQKMFFKYDLKGATFQNCIFSNSKIQGTVLNDCSFEHCRFHNITFSNSFLAGAQFLGCTLEHVIFENVKASFIGMPPDKVDDWYRALVMDHTSIDHTHFTGCDLRGSQLDQCTTIYTTLENTLVENSDFSTLT